jgi:hypothetical protein
MNRPLSLDLDDLGANASETGHNDHALIPALNPAVDRP